MSRPITDATVKFWRSVEKTADCWFWRGTVNALGYGQFGHDNHVVLARRFSYELHHSTIPDGSRILQSCGVRLCVRPDHLLIRHLAPPLEPRKKETPAERFWRQVQKGDNCWLWVGATTGSDYGQFTYDGKPVSAHRFSYELHKGPITDDRFVCHTCDVPACVNPDHLFLGTLAENFADMRRKGRGQKGSSQGSAVLDEDKAVEIRRLFADGGITTAELARRYGVSFWTIGLLLKRKTWRHV